MLEEVFDVNALGDIEVPVGGKKYTIPVKYWRVSEETLREDIQELPRIEVFLAKLLHEKMIETSQAKLALSTFRAQYYLQRRTELQEQKVKFTESVLTAEVEGSDEYRRLRGVLDEKGAELDLCKNLVLAMRNRKDVLQSLVHLLSPGR